MSVRIHLPEVLTRAAPQAVDFDAIVEEFELPGAFDAAAEAEAAGAVDRCAAERVDATDVPFVTIDPPGAMDLDQAVHLEADGAGFRVRYAIADVGALVAPDGALAAAGRVRGQTYYLPDRSVPLHPRALSEGAGSLLPDVVRPVALWDIRLAADGSVRDVSVRRAAVRSVARLDYAGVQADVDAGRTHPSVALLPQVGRLRAAWGRAHGAVDLALPAQEAVRGEDGWGLRIEPRTEVDAWNAQISLLTGACAASLMLAAGVGLLRTLPPPGADTVEALRRSAAALGVTWPDGATVGDVLAGVDASTPVGLALMTDATSLLRGAGYAPFDGTPPAQPLHAGVGSPYAHVTAPLRRFADRYATEVALAASAGRPVPDWARAGLAPAADVMRRTDAVGRKVDRACLDLTEAVVLAGRVGETFDAVVLRDDEIFIADPTVFARCKGATRDGERLRVRLVGTDPVGRTVTFEPAT